VRGGVFRLEANRLLVSGKGVFGAACLFQLSRQRITRCGIVEMQHERGPVFAGGGQRQTRTRGSLRGSDMERERVGRRRLGGGRSGANKEQQETLEQSVKSVHGKDDTLELALEPIAPRAAKPRVPGRIFTPSRRTFLSLQENLSMLVKPILPLAALMLLAAPLLLTTPTTAAPVTEKALLPAPWKDTDIGKVGVPGSAARVAAGTFTVTAAGEDIYGQADSFHFVYQPLHGDGQIVARVVSYQRKDMWTKVGVMVRETTDPGAKFADVLVTPDKGAESQWRPNTNGDTQTTDQVPSPTPFWVKMVRIGDTLTSYVSPDGKAWQQRGQATVAMTPDALIGLCVTSHKNDETTEAKMDSVRVGKIVPAIP